MKNPIKKTITAAFAFPALLFICTGLTAPVSAHTISPTPSIMFLIDNSTNLRK
jgi:hypothetical protein